jgi:hypothetical protein
MCRVNRQIGEKGYDYTLSHAREWVEHSVTRFATFQTFAVLSSLAVAKRLPSGLKMTLSTIREEWPRSVNSSRPSAASQILAVSSPVYPKNLVAFDF